MIMAKEKIIADVPKNGCGRCVWWRRRILNGFGACRLWNTSTWYAASPCIEYELDPEAAEKISYMVIKGKTT